MVKNNPVLGIYAKTSPTILVRIPMRKPSDICKSNTDLKELRMNVEAVERIQIPEDILPKPLDIITKN